MNNIYAEIFFTAIGSGVTITEFVDSLTRKIYRFEYYEEKHGLFIRRYFKHQRKSKQHGYEQIEAFGSWDKRQDTLDKMPGIPEEITLAAVECFKNNLAYIL